MKCKKKMRVLLELAKKMRVLPRQLSNTAIYWMKSLCCIEEYPLFFCKKKWGYSPDCCLTLPSIGWNHCCIEEYPHFFCKSEEYPYFFLQVRGVPSFFFANSRGSLIFFCNSRRRAIFFCILQIYQISTNWTNLGLVVSCTEFFFLTLTNKTEILFTGEIRYAVLPFHNLNGPISINSN